MASIALRSKFHSLILKPHQTLFISSRFCSSSSSNDDENSPEKPINFSDKNPKSDQQPQQSSSSGSSFDEIRKNLSQFTRRSPESQMPNTLRNLNARNAAEQNPNSPKKGEISIDSIRKTLRMMKDNQPKTTNNANDQFSLNKYRDSLKSTPPSSSSSPLSLATEKKDGIFNTGGGRGGVIGGSFSNLPGTMIRTKMGEGEDVDEESKYRLIRLYSHEDLGQKLRELRPNTTKISTVSKKGKEGEGNGYTFSLSELQQRLGKLKAAEEANVASQSGNVPFDELRMVLGQMELKKDQKWKMVEKQDIFHPKSSPPKEHLIEKYFHPDNMSSAEKLKIELKKVRDEFKMSETDCGSTRVQIAQLTTEIHHLSSVLAKKDKHSRRGLLAKVQKRKKLLKYLRRTDWDSYCFVLSKLGLRDNTDYKNL